jgi:hypothetical protein
MITVHYTSISKKKAFNQYKESVINEYSGYLLIDFLDELNTDNPIIDDNIGVIISDFENCTFSKWVLMQIFEEAKDVILFINKNNSRYAKDIALVNNLRYYESLLGSENFVYFNHATLNRVNNLYVKDTMNLYHSDTNKVVDICSFINDNEYEIKMLVDKYIQPNVKNDYNYYSFDNIMSKSRIPKLSFIRHLLAYLLTENDCTCVYIAHLLRKDHSTILHSVGVIKDYLQIYADNQDKLIIENLVKKMGIELKKANGITV